MDIDEAITAAAALRTQGANGEARSLLHAALAETGLSGAEQARLHYQLAWCCDAAGDEAAAVPFYERALALGLAGEERSGALLGLGSTYRALGRYADAERTLVQGMADFPDRLEFAAFWAITRYNQQACADAVRLLVQALAASSANPGIQRYRRALLFYADHLDEVW